MAFSDELANLMPVAVTRSVRSPTGSWLAAATSPSRVASPTPNSAPQVNGARASPPTEVRPARQDKKRLSLAFFSKGTTGDTTGEKEHKAEKKSTEDHLDAASTTTSSRSRSKETTKNRLSLSFLAPNSPPPEALPHFPSQAASQQSLGQGSSRSQGVDGRPETSKSGKSGKSGKSEKSELHRRGGSMKKRLSVLGIGKKTSKNNVKGRVDDTLAEE